METFNKSRNIITPRRFGGAGVVFLFTIFAAGCGIPDFAYLEPPQNVLKFNNTKESSFTNASDNNPDLFIGYQVYGKFYNYGSDTDGSIYTESNQITSFAKLTSLDFFRLVKPDTTGTSADPDPVIKLSDDEKGESIRFTLDFNGDVFSYLEEFNTVIKNNIDSEVIKVARNVLIEGAVTGERVLKSFYIDDLLPDHSDLKNLEPPDGEITLSYIYLSIFILSYGRESDGYTPVYSEPVYLGYVELPVDSNAGW